MGPLPTPSDQNARRVQRSIFFVGAVYFAAHVGLGAWLLPDQEPLATMLLVTTLVVAVGNAFVAVPLWVMNLLALWRGPRALVALPEPVEDDDLPSIVVQVPGRHEPFDLVRRSIDSVLRSDYPPDRLRVQFIDNSDDARWRDVAAHYAAEPRVRVMHRQGTRGFKAGNLNIGLERLDRLGEKGVLLGLLDVGDTFGPKTLRPMATEFVHDPRLGFAQGMFRTGNPDDSIVTWTDALIGDAARRYSEGYYAHYGVPTMNGHCVLLRMAALDDVGRWNEARVAEDWSTGVTMLCQGWNGKWVDYDANDPDMVSTELVPADVPAQQKQKRRWATGAAELTKLHLGEWLRSPMPWHQKQALLLRLGANLSVLPFLVLQLLLPAWVAMAVWSNSPEAVIAFGLASSFIQNPFVVSCLVAALNYAREGHVGRGLAILVAYPIDALWRLPLFVHAAIGIVEGLSQGLKTFVITPKVLRSDSVFGRLRSQRLVLGVSLLGFLPLMAIALFGPSVAVGPAAVAALVPVMTVAALFLVPAQRWVERHLMGR